MRLIHFTASTIWRGHEQKIIYLYEGFTEKNYTEKQWIICPKDSEIYKVAVEKQFNVLTFDLKKDSKLKVAKQLKAFSKENNVDLIFMHSSKAHTIGVLSSFVLGLKTPLVLCRTMIKKIDTNFFRKWKYNYKGIKKIICVSQPVVDVLQPAINDRSRLSIVGSVTDINKFYKKEKNGSLHKEFNIPLDYKIIGNISAFVKVKDHVTWVNTALELKQRGIKAKYILVGNGPLEEEIKAMVAEKGLSNDVIFAGFRKDIPEILPEFDLFLFTSNNEATGSVVLEAYACNVPAIAANSGGTFEVLVNGETGFLAESGNAIDFADKAEKIISTIIPQKNS